MTDLIDSLPRSAKLLIDNGSAATVEAALEILGRYRLHLHIGEHEAGSPTHQATLLTAVNCARRCLLGGVTVSGALDRPNLSALASGATLADAVHALGGMKAGRPDEAIPVVHIGGSAPSVAGPALTLRTTFDGWRGGVVPAGHAIRLAERREFPLAGCLAGALAVSVVFAHLTGDVLAGARPVGLSLWDPSPECDWVDAALDGPAVEDVPSAFWLIGLGHLGQAYLWCMAALPFAERGAVQVVLQDVDRAGGSTPSTSVLTEAADEGRFKTRVCAAWCEARGFQTRLVERQFGADMRRGPDEPGIALCGVDNPDARRVLDGAGFPLVLEAGLGSGADDFRLIRVHSFPAATPSSAVWPSAATTVGNTAEIEARPAYGELMRGGRLDACGITRLAQVAVGAPFVGMTAAALVIAQAVRVVAGAPRATVINLDLRDPSHRSAVLSDNADVVTFACAAAELHHGG